MKTPSRRREYVLSRLTQTAGTGLAALTPANLPDSSLGPLNDLGLTGIYYGFARVHPSTSTPLPTASPTPAITPSQSSTSLPQLATANAAAAHGSYHPSAPKSIGTNPLTAEDISALPAQTAPYPPDSVESGASTPAPRRLPDEDGKVWPMVMSVGWNPYFKNEKITAVSRSS